MNAIEKLQRLVELDEQRKSYESSLHSVLAEMRKIIGDGFEIPGARVRPIKSGKLALPKVTAPTASPVIVQPTQAPAAAPPQDGARERASISARVLSALSGAGMRGIAAPEIAERLGITVTQATSAIMYLVAQDRLSKVAPGLYRAK